MPSVERELPFALSVVRAVSLALPFSNVAVLGQAKYCVNPGCGLHRVCSRLSAVLMVARLLSVTCGALSLTSTNCAHILCFSHSLVFQDKNKYNAKKYRFVARISNKYVTCQVVYSTMTGDVVMESAHSSELPRYGVKVGLANYAACYCTGLLLARRVLTKLKVGPTPLCFSPVALLFSESCRCTC